MKILRYIFFIPFIFTGCVNDTGKSGSPDPVHKGSPAERLSIETTDSMTVLKVMNPWQGSPDVNLTYYLVRRGSKVPEGTDLSHVIYVPVQRIVCMSVTHAAMIEALGEENTITGISGTDLVFSEKIGKRIRSGEVKEVGYEASLNNELILQMSPDLVMMYGIGGESAAYVNKIRELGIKVMFNADYLETDPLGKAGWLRLFGALYCKEKLADSIFRAVSENYNMLKENIGRSIGSRPKVLLGLPYKDTWYISPGNSYMSRIISDAGGEYLWSDTESETSMPFGLENVYIRALEADFWLNIGTVRKKEDISAVDHRLEGLPCFENGNLFNNDKRLKSRGENDYWETGTVHPEILLKDLANILHPGLSGKDELFFYRQIR